MKLDTTTVVVISILIDIILLFILVHAWRTRTTYPGFIAWIAGTACWSIGSALVLLFHNMHPQFIPKVLGTGLIMLHPLLLYKGLIRFHNIPRRWWDAKLNMALVLIGLLNQIYFLYVDENMTARTVGLNIILAILFARTAFEPLCHAHSRRHSMQWLLSLCLLPLITMISVRAGAYLFISPEISMSNMITSDSLLRMTIFYGIIVELVIAYSYLSLTSDRVEEELRQSENRYRDLSTSLQELVEEETKRRLIQERLLTSQSRMAAMGEMISAIAHQWRQPLATLGMIVQRAHAVGKMQGMTNEYLDEFKANAMRQVRYMSDTIEEFRGFYRPEKEKEPFFPLKCINDAVRLFEPQFTNSGIVVDIHCRDEANRLITGFPNEFKQVILNLLGNARDAILESRRAGEDTEQGRINVQVCVTAYNAMNIDISDNGCGLTAEIALRIFEPYFTTKEEKGGTGIGLYMSRMIVEDSFGGQLSLLQGNNGTTFKIELALGEQP